MEFEWGYFSLESVLDSALELSSMGIRVDAKSLFSQLEISGEMDRIDLPYHKSLINDELPLTIGGGIGQSRICMFFLQKFHIGEVQASIWPQEMIDELRAKDINYYNFFLWREMSCQAMKLELIDKHILMIFFDLYVTMIVQNLGVFFLKLHDRDKHEVFHLLYPEKKKKLSKLLSPSEFADVFVWMDKEDQEDAIEYLAKEFLIEVLTFVPADDIAELVDYSDRFESEYILDLLDTTRRDQVREMLAYEDETAGAIMIKEYISVSADSTLSEAIEHIRQIGHRAETIYYLYVLDQQRHLVGVISMRDLILSPSDELIKNVMYDQIVSVYTDTDQEEVARVIQI